MAILDDLLAGVYLITNRPDLVQESIAAVSRALNAAHLGQIIMPGMPPGPATDFNFDLVEASIDISAEAATNYPPSGGNVASFTIQLPDRFRKLKYAQLDNSVRLTETPPAALFDKFSSLQQTNCYYIAGRNFVARAQNGGSTFYWGYYQTPSLADSFIAQNFPQLIQWKAAAEIFAMSDDNKKTYYEQLFQQQKYELMTNYFDF